MYNNIALLLGHMMGDYLLQSRNMAILKSSPGWDGTKWCLLHCFLYALAVAAFVVAGGWTMFGVPILLSFLAAFCIAFLTHYPFDRTSFGIKWMKWIGQSSFDGETIEMRKGFIPLIYVAIDNTIHMVLMWLAYSFMGA